MRRAAAILAFAALLSGASTAPAVQDPGILVEEAGFGFLPSTEVFNFPVRGRVGGLPKFVGKFDAWVPFQAILVNNGPARTGVLTLRPLQGGAGEAISYSRQITLPQDGRKRFSFPVRATYESMLLTFRDDRAGAVRLGGEWEHLVREPRIAAPNTEIVLIATDAKTNYRNYVFPRRRSEQAPDRAIVVVAQEQLPSTALEYDSVGLLILDDIAADALTPAQNSAIHQWVCRGGAVVITLLHNAHRIKGTHLEPLLAGPPGQVRNVKYMKPFEDATSYLCGLDAETAVQTFDVPDGAEGDPMLLTRRVDRGISVACGLPLSSKVLEAWPAAPHLIDAFLKLARPARIPLPGGLAAQRVRDPIAPAMKGSVLKSVPPFKTVSVLMIVYVLALVVLPYAVMRPFRRLELAWFGVVALALAGSGIVYGVGVGYLKTQSVATRVTIVEGGSAGGPHVRHNYWCLFSARGGSADLGFEDPPVLPFPFGRQLALRGAGSASEPLQAAFDPDAQVRAFPMFAQDSVLLETTDTVTLPGTIRFQVQKGADGTLRGNVEVGTGFPLRDAWIVDGPRILPVKPGSFEIPMGAHSVAGIAGSLLEQKGFEAVTRALEVADDRGRPALLYRYEGTPSLTNTDIKEEAIHFGILESSAWSVHVHGQTTWTGVIRAPVDPSIEVEEIEFTLRTRDIPPGYEAQDLRISSEWARRGCRFEIYDRVAGQWKQLGAQSNLKSFTARTAFGGFAIRARVSSRSGLGGIFGYQQNVPEAQVMGISRIKAATE
ncbi:MAG TPA: hypothetical protein VFS19_00520 [Planctomycetota bacterium]|nr:hypothetical protein [Planctomycetota bacterium]